MSKAILVAWLVVSNAGFCAAASAPGEQTVAAMKFKKKKKKKPTNPEQQWKVAGYFSTPEAASARAKELMAEGYETDIYRNYDVWVTRYRGRPKPCAERAGP